MKAFLLSVLTWCALGLVPVGAHADNFEYEVIPGGAMWNSCELNRASAIKWAKIASKNQANDDCRNLGKGWYFDKVLDQGYEQAIPCRNGDAFKAEITKARYSCKRRVSR